MMKACLLGLMVCITLLLQVNFAVAATAGTSWSQLNPAQQEALRPLSTQWDTLEPRQQKHLLSAAKRYPKLTAEKKLRFQSNLPKWVQLTPEQRNRAREKSKALKKLPPAKLEHVKQQVREREASKTITPASSVMPVTPAH